MTWDEAVEFCRKLSERPEEKLAGLRVSTTDRSGVGVRVPSRDDDEVQFR